MKKPTILILAVVLVLPLFGGGSKETKQEAPKAAPGKITILCVTSPETTALKAAAEEFKKKNPGFEINFSEQGRLGYFTNVTTQLVGGTDAFDLVQDNTTYITELAAAGVIDPYDTYLYNKKYTDLADYDLDDIPVKLVYNGKIYCIPTDLSSQITYIRKDLLQKVPETWEDLLENAKKFDQAGNPSSPVRYGITLTALTGGPEAPKIFYTLLWSMGGNVIDDKGNVVINSPAGKKAGEYYRELAKYLPKEVTTYDYTKVFDGLKAGLTAQAAPFWNAAWNSLPSSDSAYKDKYAIGLIPGTKQADGTIKRTPQTHGWGLVINTNSKNKAAAWEFLKYATGKEGFRVRGKVGSSVYRTSILNDKTYATGEYYPIMAETYKLAKMEPLVTYYSKLHEVLNVMVAGFLTTTTPIEDILAKAEKDINELKKTYK
jgi:ABC-type glycerol-3-phosphate transport system substrate-binding protein